MRRPVSVRTRRAHSSGSEEGPPKTDLAEPHHHLIRVEHFYGAGVINGAIYGAISWLLLNSMAEIPMWGEKSVGGDVLATRFILPFATYMVESRIVRSQVRTGKLPALKPDQIPSTGLHTKSILVRGLV